MKIEVVRWRDRKPGDNTVYIGRGSPLGNPFVIGKDGDRDEVCEKYHRWFHNEVTQQNSPVNLEIRTLIGILRMDNRPLKLGCFCAPQRCHGDTIKRYLEELWR